jgi:hypothetical protein
METDSLLGRKGRSGEKKGVKRDEKGVKRTRAARRQAAEQRRYMFASNCNALRTPFR